MGSRTRFSSPFSVYDTTVPKNSAFPASPNIIPSAPFAEKLKPEMHVSKFELSMGTVSKNVSQSAKSSLVPYIIALPPSSSREFPRL